MESKKNNEEVTKEIGKHLGDLSKQIEEKNSNNVKNVVVALETAMMTNDLSYMQPAARLLFVKRICDGLGISIETMPFEFIKFKGFVKLYANKGCAEQLRRVRNISIKITDRADLESKGVFMVTAEATDNITGRTDSAIGAVTTKGLCGESLCNALMKAETKAKRRVTLSICGLNMLDECELEGLGKYQKMAFNKETGDLSSGDFVESEEYKKSEIERRENLKEVHDAQEEDFDIMKAQALFADLWKQMFKLSKEKDKNKTLDAYKLRLNLKGPQDYKNLRKEELLDAIEGLKNSINVLSEN